MGKYNTVQKDELKAFMSRHSDKDLTAAEIADMMKRDPEVTKAPGESTVYRLIKELVEAGEIKRTVKGNSRTFVYRLLTQQSCHSHLHMKCQSCGKLYHMNDEESRELVEKIRSIEHFELDSSAVLPGRCEECSITVKE